MSRYIDADRLLDALYEHEFTILCPLDEVSNVIDAEPTADVEEVVRCKSCRYRLNDADFSEGHFCIKRRSNGGMFCRDNDFCNYGERKMQE